MSEQFTWSNCITCGVRYAVPTRLMDHQRKEGGFHYCCNGHQQGWSKEDTEDEKVRRERDRLKQRLAQKNDELAADRRRSNDKIEAERERTRAAERREAAQKGNVTKLKKRAARGVCPCCQLHFTNLERHMNTKHPEFIDTPDVGDLKVIEGGKK